MEWPKQKHHHCKDIDTNIQCACENPTLIIPIVTMKHQEIEWYSVVSELY